MRTYAHLFTRRTCEAPGCKAERCDIYLTAGGKHAVRACCGQHAEKAEADLRRLEELAPTRRAA